MSKQEQIDELKRALVELHADREKWRQEAIRLGNEKRGKVVTGGIIQLSPYDRDLLRSAKNFTEGSFRLVWGNDL